MCVCVAVILNERKRKKMKGKWKKMKSWVKITHLTACAWVSSNICLCESCFVRSCASRFLILALSSRVLVCLMQCALGSFDLSTCLSHHACLPLPPAAVLGSLCLLLPCVPPSAFGCRACVPPRSPWVLPTSPTLTSFFFSCLSCSPSIRFPTPFSSGIVPNGNTLHG